jgi:hypothetical protein
MILWDIYGFLYIYTMHWILPNICVRGRKKEIANKDTGKKSEKKK